MDFSFTEEQQMLRDGVGKYLEKSYDFDARQAIVRGEEPWSSATWEQFAEFGLLALPFAEDQGGLGGSISDCVAVAELFGKHLVVEPYAASILLAGGALAASKLEAAAPWLEKVISGKSAAAFAYEEGHGTASLAQVGIIAEPADDGFILTGEKRLVIAGSVADVLVVIARRGDGGPADAFLVEQGAAGLTLRSYTTVDGRSAANITFAKTPAQSLGVSGEVLEQVIAHAMIVQSAEAVGAMGALMALTGDYAATRKQFGVPIGSFQSIAHRLADMKIAYTKARATLIYTTALAESGRLRQRDLAILKGQIGKLGKAVGESAIQIHGGVGMTDELSISHYHKRLLALDAQFGSHGYHLRTLGMRPAPVAA